MKANEYEMNMPQCYFEMDSDEVMYQGGTSGLHAYSAQRVLDGQEEQDIGTGQIVGWVFEGLAALAGVAGGFYFGGPLFGIIGIIGLATFGFQVGTSIYNTNEANAKNVLYSHDGRGIGV